MIPNITSAMPNIASPDRLAMTAKSPACKYSEERPISKPRTPKAGAVVFMPAVLLEPVADGVEESVETVDEESIEPAIEALWIADPDEQMFCELQLPIAPIPDMSRFHSARNLRGDGSLLRSAGC